MLIQQKLSNIRTFNELLSITRNVSSHISLWGNRYVVVKGYKGSLDLMDLSSKVEELIMKRTPWDEKNRQEGKLVSQEIERLYEELSGMQGNCWRVTKLFLQFRDHFFSKPGLNNCHPPSCITDLFDSPNLEFEGGASYNPERTFRYLEILNKKEDGSPAPDTVRVKIVDRPCALSNARTFDELLFIARRSTAHLSFWGSRYIKVQGYKGWLPIAALSDKVEELIMRKIPWTSDARRSGKLVLNEIKRVEDEYLKQKKYSNWITFIFLLTRTGLLIEEGTRKRFYFGMVISLLFNVTRLEYVGNAEYDPERRVKHLRVRDQLVDYDWLPTPAHIEITDDPRVPTLGSAVAIPFAWEYR